MSPNEPSIGTGSRDSNTAQSRLFAWQGRTLAALALAALVAVSGCVTVGSPDDGAMPAESETYDMNESVELAQNDTTFEVAVVDYRLTETYRTASGVTETVPPGKQFLFVKVRATNVGPTSGAAPGVDVQPGNASAVSDRPVWMSNRYVGTFNAVPAGDTESGWEVYVVPENTTSGDVRVAFSTDIIVTQDEFRWTLD